MDIQEIQKLCKEIERKSGKGSIFTVGKSSSLDIPRWPTGIESLDKIIGGGMPKGRIVEIFGPESSGKTSLGLRLMFPFIQLGAFTSPFAYDPRQPPLDGKAGRFGG
jgi:recombination protein RecA